MIVMCLGDRKVDLVRKLHNGNVTMVTELFNQLPPETIRTALEEARGAGNVPFGGVSMPDAGLNYVVKRNAVRLLLEQRDMSTSIIDAFMLMLQVRAHARELAWFTRTGNNKAPRTAVSTYKPLLKNISFQHAVAYSQAAEFMQLNSLVASVVGLVSKAVQYADEDGRWYWAAIVVDVAQRKLYLVDVVQRCPLQRKLELREQAAPLLEYLGMAGLSFEPGSYAPVLCCMQRPLEITRTSAPVDCKPSRYESGLYMCCALYYIFSDTPIYFTEHDVHNNNCIANKLVQWIKDRGKMAT